MYRHRFSADDGEWTVRRGSASEGRAWHETLVFERDGQQPRCVHAPDPNWIYWCQERMRELLVLATPCDPQD